MARGKQIMMHPPLSGLNPMFFQSLIFQKEGFSLAKVINCSSFLGIILSPRVWTVPRHVVALRVPGPREGGEGDAGPRPVVVVVVGCGVGGGGGGGGVAHIVALHQTSLLLSILLASRSCT